MPDLSAAIKELLTIDLTQPDAIGVASREIDKAIATLQDAKRSIEPLTANTRHRFNGCTALLRSLIDIEWKSKEAIRSEFNKTWGRGTQVSYAFNAVLRGLVLGGFVEQRGTPFAYDYRLTEKGSKAKEQDRA